MSAERALRSLTAAQDRDALRNALSELAAICTHAANHLRPEEMLRSHEFHRALDKAESLLAGTRPGVAYRAYADALRDLGAPPPLRASQDRPGRVTDAAGRLAFQVAAPPGDLDGARAYALALWIVTGVNSCAGFRATVEPKDADCTPGAA